MDGVLKSWAVPKGPSMNPADKRLAMMVEDHPYKEFKVVIPSGYGAGIVEIWDKGKYTDTDNSTKAAAAKKLSLGLHTGNLKFTLGRAASFCIYHSNGSCKDEKKSKIFLNLCWLKE